MKNYLKIASVLSLIALVCAAIIASVYMLTSPIIASNSVKAELEVRQAIFPDYDLEKSEEIEVDNANILSKILAKDAAGKELGYLYTVSQSNEYGNITLMVAIDTKGNVLQVEFLKNEQSFGSTVAQHVKENYPSSKDNVIYIGIQPEETVSVGALTQSQVDAIDTKCGATFGANMVKDLVKIALKDAEGGK
jgi:Na+-translocating ferredoxin:NAD+ oxidoreductase RnfG subunit